jgi:hypothetical protein
MLWHYTGGKTAMVAYTNGHRLFHGISSTTPFKSRLWTAEIRPAELLVVRFIDVDIHPLRTGG